VLYDIVARVDAHRLVLDAHDLHLLLRRLRRGRGRLCDRRRSD
jgi:hypothetical protein